MNLLAGTKIVISKHNAQVYDQTNNYAQTDNYWNDASGLRVKKTEDAMGTWKTTYTMFEGDNPIMQEIYTASGRIQVTFNVIVAGKILAQYKMVYPSTQSVVYFYLDHLDSRRVVQNAAAAVIDRYSYSAWGAVTPEIGSDHYESFTGKDYDASGLIYFNARYYDPAVGRFITEDPSKKGVNWYSYCENDPVNRRDPTGLQEQYEAIAQPALSILPSNVPPNRPLEIVTYSGVNNAGANTGTAQAFPASATVCARGQWDSECSTMRVQRSYPCPSSRRRITGRMGLLNRL